MSTSLKKYYWIKLKESFFDDRNIRFLRKQKDGYAMVCVYLMLQCRALKTEGLLNYRRIMPSLEDDVAFDIDVDVSIVKAALDWFEKLDLIERVDDNALLMSARDELIEIGKEGESAERVRKYRERQKALHCND